MIMKPLVSIVIPCRNEEKYIEKCIDSIIDQDYPKDLLEIIIVDGNSNDNTLDKLKRYNFDNLKIVINEREIVPISMNLGINLAKGDYIIRMDVHCEYPVNYISKLVFSSIKYNADNVGTIMNTLPADNSLKSKCIALAISHPLGVGNSYFRIGSKKVMEVDTVPFGCYRREVFNKIGLYDEELIRNQDDELNARLLENGGKILLLSDVSLNYYARNSIKSVSKMFYQYGLFKPLVNTKIKKPSTYRQFAPLLLVLFIFFGFFSIFISQIIFKIYLGILLTYFIILVSTSFRIKITNKLKTNALFILPIIFFMIHISYGCGYIIGIYKVLNRKKINVTINR